MEPQISDGEGEGEGEGGSWGLYRGEGMVSELGGWGAMGGMGGMGIVMGSMVDRGVFLGYDTHLLQWCWCCMCERAEGKSDGESDEQRLKAVVWFNRFRS